MQTIPNQPPTPADPNAMISPTAAAPAAPKPGAENKMLQYQQKNIELLGEIAGNQEIILTEMRSRNRVEKMRFWFGVVKSIGLAFIVLLSFWFSFKMINSMMGNLGGLMGGNFNVESLLNPSTKNTRPGPSASGNINIEKMMDDPGIQGLLNNFLK